MELFYDIKGYPIYPGDVLRIFHFIAAVRRERRYMYKVVIEENGTLYGVDICELATMGIKNAHKYRLKHNEENGVLPNTEIVQGHGPGEYFCYRQRKRRRNV